MPNLRTANHRKARKLRRVRLRWYAPHTDSFQFIGNPSRYIAPRIIMGSVFSGGSGRSVLKAPRASHSDSFQISGGA